MRLLTRTKTPAEQLKHAAVGALRRDPGRSQRAGLTGVSAVATGAVLYTAGRAAFKARRSLRERSSDRVEDDETTRPHEEHEKPDAAEREPARAARRKGAPPSLELPHQRWPRFPAGRTDARR